MQNAKLVYMVQTVKRHVANIVRTTCVMELRAPVWKVVWTDIQETTVMIVSKKFYKLYYYSLILPNICNTLSDNIIY